MSETSITRFEVATEETQGKQEKHQYRICARKEKFGLGNFSETSVIDSLELDRAFTENEDELDNPSPFQVNE